MIAIGKEFNLLIGMMAFSPESSPNEYFSEKENREHANILFFQNDGKRMPNNANNICKYQKGTHKVAVLFFCHIVNNYTISANRVIMGVEITGNK